MSINVRDYTIDDLPELIDIYKSSFAEAPWNETWSDKQVVRGLNSGISESNSIVLVAENSNGLIGLTWGFDIPLEKFPFLVDNCMINTSYIAELAVSPRNRNEGVGTLLGEAYVERAMEKRTSEIILRTDERNPAALKLYKNVGFSEINVRDPKYNNRIYLSKLLEEKNGI